MTDAERIVTVVAAKYLVTFEEMCGPRRLPHLVEARAEAAVRLYMTSDLTLREIGEALGGRHHSTISRMIHRERRKAA